MNQRTIVVCDIEQRAALAAARALGAAGWRVLGVGAVKHAPARRSRFVSSYTEVPAPLSHPADFAAALTRFIASQKDALILPVTEASHLAIYAHAPALHTLLAPSAIGFHNAADKGLVMQLAAEHGIRVPTTFTIESPLSPLPAFSVPRAVIKPARSVPLEGEHREKRDVQYVASSEEVRRTVLDAPASAFPLLLQERIEGNGLGLSVVLWQGKLLGASAHRRLLEKPPSGGVSVLSESLAVPDALLQRCVGLLATLGFHSGAAMLEFKGRALEDAALMEINPRLWGSLQLAIDAGVPAPVLLANASQHQLLGAPVLSTPGVRLRWFWGSVDHVIARVRRQLEADGSAAHQPVGIGPAWRETFRQTAREEVGRTGDVWPFAQESWNWLCRR